MFILSAERDREGAFSRYQKYLEQNRAKFPPSAYTLATSDWYYSSSDSRCPHDARLRSLTISEPPHPKGHEPLVVSLRIRLMGWQDDGHIELFYPRVYSYRLDTNNVRRGHCDWRYDEFRVTENGRLLHEIEWWSMNETGRWLIETSDVEFAWQPI